MKKTLTGTPRELAQVLFLLKQDKEYEIKEYIPLRGTQANRYFHKLVNELAKYNRASGYAISNEEMKIKMNLAYGTLATTENGEVIEIIIPKGTDLTSVYNYVELHRSSEKYDYYLVYKNTHELNSKEFYQLIKGVEQECRDVGIKTLDDIEFEKMMEEYEKDIK